METALTSASVLGSISPKLRATTGNRAAMEKAAKDFEAVFMAQMLKPMWEGVETDAMFGGGVGEDVMKDMLVQEYGKSMCASDNFGLSRSVLDAMIQIQEKANGAVANQGGQS